MVETRASESSQTPSVEDGKEVGTRSSLENNSKSMAIDSHDIATQKQTIKELAKEFNINERKLMAKIDFMLVPSICILYLMAFLDRINISNANVYGMGTDLNLYGYRFNTALTIFFVPYVLSEVPSNYLVKRLKPHLWLSACMVVFGAVMLGQGFVKNYGGLLVTRFFLGIFEAGMFPGCFYLLSMWYRRDEAQKRYSFFFSSTCLAGAFGGLIAYGVHRLDMKRGLESWRWLFIIEGVVTIAIAIVLFFTIPDFPEDAKFLTANEREFIRRKLEMDVLSSGHEETITVKDVFRAFKDWKVVMGAFMYFGQIVPAYGYAYFSQSIIIKLKYSPVQTQLHSIPPWVVAFGLSMICAVFSDRIRHRFGFVLFSILFSAGGFIMLLANHTNLHVRYAGLFLIASGCYTAMPLMVCWTNMNFAGHLKKSVGSGFQIGFGNIGGIISSFSYLSKDAPYYTKGVGIGLAFMLFSLVCCTGYLFGVAADNKKKQTQEYIEKWDQKSARDKTLFADENPEFVYSY